MTVGLIRSRHGRPVPKDPLPHRGLRVDVRDERCHGRPSQTKPLLLVSILRLLPLGARAKSAGLAEGVGAAPSGLLADSGRVVPRGAKRGASAATA